MALLPQNGSVVYAKPRLHMQGALRRSCCNFSAEQTTLTEKITDLKHTPFERSLALGLPRALLMNSLKPFQQPRSRTLPLHNLVGNFHELCNLL